MQGLFRRQTPPTERAPAEAETREQVTNQFAHIELAFESAFHRALASGELHADANPRSLARFLLAAMNGLRIIGKAAPDRAVLADIAATTLAGLPFNPAAHLSKGAS